MEVKFMYRQGASIRAIARQTGLSRATVCKILQAPVAKGYGTPRSLGTDGLPEPLRGSGFNAPTMLSP